MNFVDDLDDRKISQHISWSHFAFFVHSHQRIQIVIAIDKQLYFEKLIKLYLYLFIDFQKK